MAAEDGEEAAAKDEESEEEEVAAKDEELKAEEIAPPNNISVYDMSASSGHSGLMAWGCTAGTARKKHCKRPEKVEKVRASRASGSRTPAVKPKKPTKACRQLVDEQETNQMIQASTVAETIPVIHLVYEYKELRTLQELLMKADTCAVVLMKALEEVNTEHTATIRTLGVTILHREEQQVRKVEREWAEIRRAIEEDKEGEELEQED
ncbi:hypothetical protein BDN71DRAFT_1512697 [Pleurotus eryngii]|uniref:Uncharacterized protein n=1 Tax=Pleurotus eryngii TaxID=5323 RepID=A0A9P6D1H9_PLEER|nr:hypothetical protein BDN71DRAFT_1512697 [Pleurotus eryngii]